MNLRKIVPLLWMDIPNRKEHEEKERDWEVVMLKTATVRQTVQ